MIKNQSPKPLRDWGNSLVQGQAAPKPQLAKSFFSAKVPAELTKAIEEYDVSRKSMEKKGAALVSMGLLQSNIKTGAMVVEGAHLASKS